jgi:O-antigen/teichoic acid export membrane protein
MLVLREIGASSGTGRWGRIRGVLIFSNVAVLVSSLVLGGVLAAGTALMGERISAEQAHTLYWATALIPLMALDSLRGATLRGFRRIVAGQLPELLLRPGVFIALLSAVLLAAPGRLTPAVAIMLQAVAATLAYVVGAILLQRSLPPELAEHPAQYDVRRWIGSSVPLGLTASIRAAQPNLAILLVSSLASTEAAGLFRLAQRGADLVSFVATTVGSLVPPYLARYFAAGEMARLQRLVTLAAQASTAAALLAVTVVVLGGPRLLSLLFGHDFAASYDQWLVLSVAELLSAFFGANALLMNMTGRERVVTVSFLIALPVQIVLSFPMISAWGGLGAAFAMFGAYLVWNSILWGAARRDLQIRTTAVGL